MSIKVGQDIEALCRKCGDVWHVVFAMDGDKVVRVQCKQCSGYHRYRSPNESKSSRSSSARKRSPAQPKPRIDEPQVAADLSVPIKPYRFSDEFAPGERIDHPKFGIGVVEITAEPGKMQVFFPDGRRVLARAKPRSQLERPRPFRYDQGMNDDAGGS
ncbi:hypothetical protein [Haliangium sp.]|uniref:hypothetical protein n=1 Tax=Haliangium sp. TaxID=2663208 RepID=UPI003D0BBE4B